MRIVSLRLSSDWGRNGDGMGVGWGWDGGGMNE